MTLQQDILQKHYHEDPAVLHLGTLDPHAYFIPFAPGQDPFAGRENSDRFTLLSGDWDFRYFESPLDIDLTVPARTMPVPGCWQLHGCGAPQYINAR